MTENDKGGDARTDTPPHTIMERLDVMEQRLILLMQRLDVVERALRAAHGNRWMDELKGRDESTG